MLANTMNNRPFAPMAAATMKVSAATPVNATPLAVAVCVIAVVYGVQNGLIA